MGGYPSLTSGGAVQRDEMSSSTDATAVTDALLRASLLGASSAAAAAAPISAAHGPRRADERLLQRYPDLAPLREAWAGRLNDAGAR